MLTYMVKINKHIEIVRCGNPRLSSMGLKSCNMIGKTLSRHYARVGTTTVNNEHDIALLVAKKPDLVFLGFKNMPTLSPYPTNTEESWIADHLDSHGINYTGSTKLAMMLDHNKDAAKQVICEAGLQTAPYFTARSGEYSNAGELPLPLPLFIKPPKEGGGIGIGDDSVVRNFAAYKRKVANIERDFGTPALAEQYLTGREFSVAILETPRSKELIAMPIELITEQNSRGDRILGQKVKSADTEHVIAVADKDIKDAIVTLAIDAFKILGARDYGRIDIRLDEQGIPHFLEANLIPGVAQHDFTSYFTSACWINQAMDYETMLLHIVELGLSRAVDIGEDLVERDMVPVTVSPSLEAAFEPV